MMMMMVMMMMLIIVMLNSVQFGSLYYGTETTARWLLAETAQHTSANNSVQFNSVELLIL
jgi:hypothetical protein